MAESSRIDNYPGFYGISGYDLGEKIRSMPKIQRLNFQKKKQLPLKRPKGFLVILESGKTLEAKTVIYTAGAEHRKLNVPGSDTFENKGISYCASCDGAFYKEKTWW